MVERLRAAIVGTGFMGLVHAQAVRSAGHAVGGFVGTSSESAQAAAAHFPGASGATSLDALLSAGVDVVHLCTPNALHASGVDVALAAGLSVICEKPLATTVDDARRISAEADRLGIVTGVPFVYRYYPMVREIRRRIAADAASNLWLLHGSYLQDWLADSSLTNWRVDPAQGGASRAFGDIGVHWCDLMEFVTGQRIIRLSARTGRAFTRDGGHGQNLTEDGSVVMFETNAGALGSLTVSQSSAGRRNRLWFSFDGPRASYSFDQENPESAWVGTKQGALVIDRSPEDPPRSFALPPGHPQGYQHCFNDFVSDTYSAVTGIDIPDRPQFQDGLRAAVLTQAVLDSARTEEWVEIESPGRTQDAAPSMQGPMR
jgi:predicted dehydrogenase